MNKTPRILSLRQSGQHFNRTICPVRRKKMEGPQIDPLEVLLRKWWESTKAARLAVAFLLLCPLAHADQVDTLQGTLTGIPGETITYNLTVDTAFNANFGGFYEDTMLGTVLFSDSNGVVFSTWDIGGLFGYEPNESMILAQFGESGTYAVYDVIGNASGVSIQFIPGGNVYVSTPEPTTPMLLAAALCFLLLLIAAMKIMIRTPKTVLNLSTKQSA